MPTVRLVLGCALLAGWGELGAQPAPGAFGERVEVSVVNVEVFVTTLDGAPVFGLRPEDFILLEDGAPVEITNFYAAQRADRLLESVATGTLPEPLADRTRPVDQAMNLVVYVDHFNLTANHRLPVLAALRGFLEDRLHQGDRVMLVGHDNAVRVVQPFTTDTARLAEGLDRLARVAAGGQSREAQLQQRVRAMHDAAAVGDLRTAYQHVRGQVQLERHELRSSVQAVGQVVRSLAGMPGHKAMLYVSDGLPKRPGEELYLLFSELFAPGALRAEAEFGAQMDPLIEMMNEDESHLFNAITRDANAHQVTIYTLDARGATPGSSVSAARADLSAGGAGRIAFDQARALNLQEPLIELAESTGGLAILNAGGVERSLTRLGHDLDGFYSLGFQAAHGGDGKYHKIEVRLDRPGFRVRHRSGYIDKPESERTADRTLAALLFDLEKNPLDVRLAFGAPQGEAREHRVVPLLVRIPLRGVTLLPSGGTQEGRLRIFIIVRDERGAVSELHEFPYPVSLPQQDLERALEQDVGFTTQLKLRMGVATVAVGVLDEISGIESLVLQRAAVRDPRRR
jgi:VWFA-related protein